ncbi:uncharacterized protein [Lepidochelys kempii]|uniref:uncharacterized protein isoform X2 n=1 Tax=Lepidochelys kempii TaxID=8472 RepID=UPI003C6F2048
MSINILVLHNGNRSMQRLRERQGVINMKCPEDPGWWYWNGSCYYMEETNSLTWLEAKNYCTAYNGTDLLLLDSAEEKAWVTSVLQKPVWIFSLGASQSDAEKSSRKNQHVTLSPTKSTAPDSCDQLNANGSLNQINCSSLAFWVCERREGDSMFWKYSGRLLTKPSGRDTYSSLEFALSACILKADCTGVTYWGKRYIPVTGKELIFSKNRQDAVYLRSGLTSKFCFASWKYWNGNCYYVPPYGVLNKSEAEFMCSRFQGAQLIKLNSTEEQRWIAKVIARKSWLGSLSYKLQSNSWIMPDGDRAAPRWGFRAVQDLCVQIEPVSGTLISFACSERASWICKGAPGGSRDLQNGFNVAPSSFKLFEISWRTGANLISINYSCRDVSKRGSCKGRMLKEQQLRIRSKGASKRFF